MTRVRSFLVVCANVIGCNKYTMGENILSHTHGHPRAILESSVHFLGKCVQIIDKTIKGLTCFV